jgi:PAS domain S-box-containing protein
MARLKEIGVERLSRDGQGDMLDSVATVDGESDRQFIADTRTTRQSGSHVAELDQILDLLSESAASHEGDTKEVFKVLFRTLIDTLRLDFICLRAEDESQNTCIKVTERARSFDGLREAGELRWPFHRSLSPNSDALGTEVVGQVLSREPFRFQFTSGHVRAVLAAGASRDDFPSAAEQLVLSIATRKIIRDLEGRSYDPKDTAFSASEPLEVYIGTKLERYQPSFSEQASVPEDLVRQRRKRELTPGAPDWRLRELFDLVPIMIWSSFPDGACEYINKAHYEYTGVTVAQSRNSGWQMTTHPEDLPHRIDKWRESLASGRPSEAEVRIRRYDGVYRWFLVRIEPFRDQYSSIIRWYGAATDIEEQKRAEERWSTSEKRLSLIINTIPMLIWSSSPDGHADFFNAQWYKYTAFSSSQSNGWGWTAALHPDDSPRATQYWHTTISTDHHDDGGLEVRFRRSDGEYRWFWLRANAMRGDSGVIKRWYVTSTDIQDRKLAEERGRRSQTLLDEAKRLAGLGFFSWRVGADTMTWCCTLCSMFGFDPGSPITRSMIEKRIHPDDVSFIFGKSKESSEKLENFERQMRIVMPEGSIKYLSYCAYATTALTGEIEYVGTVQDVTERHLASEALARARGELAQAARASSLGILTASIAHEVNQPLAGIVTNANTCLRMLNSDPPNINGAIETARRTIRDGNRAADVICRLRKLFSQKEIDASWWDLGSAAHEVIELVQSELRRNRITLEERYDPDLPLVKGDRIQLQQVILNLIRNAIDAVPATQEDPREVIVSISCEKDCAHLRIKDSGVGFEASVTNKLFEAFYTTKEDGMGIGLTVCRWIVEAHGGSLWAAENEDRGATFGFSIPY